MELTKQILDSEEVERNSFEIERPRPRGNVRLYVENMTPEQLEGAKHAIEENPKVITFVDGNATTDSKKTERIDNRSLNETEQTYESFLN